jgi:NitT/TauT family transport system permease protein
MPAGSETLYPVEDPDIAAFEEQFSRGPSRARKIWSALWPKLLAFAFFIGAWQFVVWTGWKPEYVLPSPFTVFDQFWQDKSTLWEATQTTLGRAVKGYSIALVLGVVTGLLVSRSKILRSGVGSMITGLQTMPSIAWFPASIVVFGLNESAILFVVVLGAAPSIANGLISGVDNIPPVLLRAGRVLGARGLSSVRHVVLPAALPSFVGGLKQGWAFAWRSLLAGELIVLLGKPALGQELQGARDLNNYPMMYSVMVMIFIIGIVVDALVFGTAERWIRRRYGLMDASDS